MLTLTDYFKPLITYFQDKNGWQRVRGMHCFSDDHTEISLHKKHDFVYIESWNVEVTSFLNFNINITGMNEESIHKLLEVLQPV